MMDKLLKNFDEKTKKNILAFLNGNYEEKEKKQILELLKKDPEKVKNAFYTNLTFGTGGIRGKMGIGTNRLNKYSIRAATLGLANYLKRENPKNPISVFIGYDSRKNSRSFAEETARVLAACNIKSYLFKTLCPTPIVSFGCREKKCSAAIMITASHNPPEYNGYKVYWKDGGQVTSPHDINIIKEVNAINDPSNIKLEKIDSPLIETVDASFFDIYIKKINNLQNFPEVNQKHGKELKIIYTSLHGTGITIIPKALESWGFSSIDLVKDQCIPDENFTHAKTPNPEETSALALGIDLMLEKKADLLIATDPDADRMAVVINHNNDPIILSGNKIAALLLSHILSSKDKKLPKNGATVKTIVTSDLISEISQSFNIDSFNVLTGFKYIAEKIEKWEKENSYQFVFGAEESLGFLACDFVRDKDSISSAALFAEAALQAKRNNKTMIDVLNSIYEKYGIYQESLLSISFKEGLLGMEQMKNIMNNLRTSPLKTIANYEITNIEDYQESTSLNLKTNELKKLNLPKSNVLQYLLSDGSKIIIRPSGTEPKIKIYINIMDKNYINLKDGIKLSNERIHALTNALTKLLKP